MPTLHRLSCFRDDIIFVIYLYQRYCYRVDLSRVNEFGQGGGEEKEQLSDVPHSEEKEITTNPLVTPLEISESARVVLDEGKHKEVPEYDID